MEESALWKGFIKCVALLQPQSFNAILHIPLSKIEAVLEDEEGLKDAFLNFTSSKDVFQSVPVKVRRHFSISLREEPGDQEAENANATNES